MQQIMSQVKLKNDHYGEPEIFLGSQLQWKNINGSECWTMISNKYVTEALKTLKITLKEQNKQLPSKVSTPLSYKYFYPKDFLTCGGPHIFRICI